MTGNKAGRTRKTVLAVIVATLVTVLAVLTYRFDQPTRGSTDPQWEASVDRPGIQREHFFIRSGGVDLEADLLVPVGGRDKKPAVVWSGGSGDSPYQDYRRTRIVETYVQDTFLPRDMAVLLVNKRGLGQSEGNWKHNDFQGRANDLYAAVRALQRHAAIDPDNIGLIGHSQGGWIVTLAASQHQDVAFFISLAGPTTTVWEQIEDTSESQHRCEGLAGIDLAKKVAKDMKWTRIGASLGKVLPLGELGFDARIMDYDPRQALRAVHRPGLLVFADHDALVPADQNLARLAEIFGGKPPDVLDTVVIPNTNHVFRAAGPCAARETWLSAPLSQDLSGVLQAWLARRGY